MTASLLADRYRLEADIGRGAMGVVYCAHDELLDRRVAVKILEDVELESEGRRRLLREAQAAARLNHPNIVQVHDAGESDGVDFIVMELVDGVSLRQAGRLPASQVTEIARQLCAALEHAHAEGIVHRDIKPENILLIGADPRVELRVKLTDFGLARSGPASRLSQEGSLVGTVFYMSPEQALGRALDGRADLYSLGVVLYEQVAGRLPFDGDDALAVVAQHVHQPAEPPSKFTPDVPPALEAVILRLLAKEPDDRFASASQVAQALDAAAAPALSNLPSPLTTFIGHRQELADLDQALASSRLISLTGSGGCGKSRLALELAFRVRPRFPQGVWLVELAQLADPSLMPAAVATALEIRETPGEPILSTVLRQLHPRHLLLILDNCEHLIEACAELAEAILEGCPEVRLLATSREALGIGGEVSFRVPSLSLPGAGRLRSQELAQSEAARLFVYRASAAAPGFEVSDENAAAIGQIVQRLDGIPLAIELAAARLKVLSVEQIADRLDDRFRLLTGGSRTALPRQQTLQATIDWSYNLLSESERTLFRRLSVFVGGWTLEAAEAVCSDETVHSGDVLDLLTRLVDKSLVVKSERGQQARYRRLETIRQYARQKLVDSGEADGIRRRQADWCVRLAEEAEPNLLGAGAASWLETIDIEIDNLRAGLEWLLEVDPAAALRLTGALGNYWQTRAQLGEGREALTRALAAAENAPPASRAKGLKWLGLLASRQADYAWAKGPLNEALAIAEAAEDRVEVAAVNNALGLLAWSQGDYLVARRHLDRAASLRRDVGDKRGLAGVLTNLANLSSAEGDLKTARRLHQESLGIFRQLHDVAGIATTSNNLGITLELEGRLEEAQQLFEDAVDASTEIGDQTTLAYSLSSLGHVLLAQGFLADAGQRQLESLLLFREQGERRGTAYVFEALAQVILAEGHPDRAARLLAAAQMLRTAIGAPLSEAERAEVDRTEQTARQGMGEGSFTEAWDEGKAMTLEQAMAYAARHAPA